MSVENIFYELFRNKFEDLPEYIIEVGVLELEKKNKRKKEGLTNAELMYIQEYGSPLNKIPARPVLQMTKDFVNENWLDEIKSECVNTYIDSNFNDEAVDKVIKKWAKRTQKRASELIIRYDKSLKPNAPSTIKQKGFDHPLFRTGQLSKSITSRVIKGDKTL